MSIETRLANLEAIAAVKTSRAAGPTVGAEILRLLREQPQYVESRRTAAMARDIDPTLRCLLHHYTN